MMKKRVVITGLGAVTPLGSGLDKFWNGIKEGKCGIDTISRFDPKDMATQIAAEVKDRTNVSVRILEAEPGTIEEITYKEKRGKDQRK